MAWAPCETFRFSRKERCGCVPRRACRNRRRGKAFSRRRECAHPRSSLRCVSKAQSKGAWLFPKPAIRSPAWPAGLRGEIKEEAAAVRRMPGDRKGVVSGKSVSVLVDLGGRRTIKKKQRID